LKKQDNFFDTFTLAHIETFKNAQDLKNLFENKRINAKTGYF